MLERQICDLNHKSIRRQSIGLDDNGTTLLFRRVEQWTELVERHLLIAEIDGGRRSAGDADHLRIDLRTKGKTRQRHGDGNSRLKDEIRAEDQKENQEEGHVQQ